LARAGALGESGQYVDPLVVYVAVAVAVALARERDTDGMALNPLGCFDPRDSGG
jgi:hypothetical protein